MRSFVATVGTRCVLLSLFDGDTENHRIIPTRNGKRVAEAFLRSTQAAPELGLEEHTRAAASVRSDVPRGWVYVSAMLSELPELRRRAHGSCEHFREPGGSP